MEFLRNRQEKGDSRAASYFLTNTGATEGDFTLQTEYIHNASLQSKLYFSSFNAHFGVLRGAHIGNLADLEEALKKRISHFIQKIIFRIKLMLLFKKLIIICLSGKHRFF